MKNELKYYGKLGTHNVIGDTATELVYDQAVRAARIKRKAVQNG